VVEGRPVTDPVAQLVRAVSDLEAGMADLRQNLMALTDPVVRLAITGVAVAA
jgi:hypothetical protein